MKKIIIAIIFILILALAFGLVYKFVLNKDVENDQKEDAQKPQNQVNETLILFEDLYDGETTTKILEDEIDVVNGYFTITPNGIDTFLRVRVTSKLAREASYSIEMAAIEKETNLVLKLDTLEVDELKPGEIREIDVFTNVDEEMAQRLRSAQYKVVKITTK